MSRIGSKHPLYGCVHSWPCSPRTRPGWNVGITNSLRAPSRVPSGQVTPGPLPAEMNGAGDEGDRRVGVEVRLLHTFSDPLQGGTSSARIAVDLGMGRSYTRAHSSRGARARRRTTAGPPSYRPGNRAPRRATGTGADRHPGGGARSGRSSCGGTPRPRRASPHPPRTRAGCRTPGRPGRRTPPRFGFPSVRSLSGAWCSASAMLQHSKRFAARFVLKRQPKPLFTASEYQIQNPVPPNCGPARGGGWDCPCCYVRLSVGRPSDFLLTVCRPSAR